MTPTLRAVTFSLSLSLLFLSAFNVRAQSLGDTFSISPFLDWQTIHSEHFRVTFPKELTAQAQKVVQYYEEAHRVLAPEMQWEPAHKVQVLVTDQTDSANGLTSAVSRFGMILYVVPPETWFSTTYYEDWLKLLVFHEYTHYLNMDVTRGFFQFTRYLFGDVILPNSLWPTWMLEGLAVYYETKYTRAGRGRSPYFEMITRAAVEQNLLDDAQYIKLDQINGERPAPPGGETPYFFGYQLMNQVEKTTEHSASEMSSRSGGRVPFFINGNVENITGKDWYQHWNDWVVRSREKANRDLSAIRKSPVTSFKIFDQDGYESLGAAINSDETLLAFSSTQKEKWQSLYIKNLETGEVERIEDKFLGVGLSFHPSAPVLVYSSLGRENQFNFYNDLKAYDTQKKSSYDLSSGLRAKDPDVSRDGKLVAYITTAGSRNALGVAALRWSEGRLRLETTKTIFTPPLFDRVANPKFSPDGKWIVFSHKKNGILGEELRRYDVKTGKIETLVSDGAMNRFPAFHPNGTLTVVSDKSGVDNIYRVNGIGGFTNGPRGAAAVPYLSALTNMTTGVWLPVFSKTKTIGSVYQTDGWKLAEIETKDVSAPQISPAEAPQPTLSTSETRVLPVESYSPWSTLLPRQWSPFLVSSKLYTQVGAQVFGYDAVFRHQYFFFGQYDTQLKQGDFLASYANRSFGPTLGLSAQQQNRSISRGTDSNSSSTYTRKTEAEASISFPFRWDVAVLKPRFAASIERDNYLSALGSTRTSSGKSRFVPTQEATLEYSNTRASSWSVAPETGRRITAGAKRYNDSEIETYKGIFKGTEYFHLGGNWVLSPSFKSLLTSKRSNRYGDANGEITGRESGIFNPFGVDDFDQFYIRGYSDRAFNATRAFTSSLDLRFPVSQIFRGWGTNPLFFDQLVMNVFAETTYTPEKTPRLKWLPSAGAGLKLNTEVLLHLPLSFGLDYHYGFNKTRRSTSAGEVFFSISFSNVLPIDI
jgi:Tol biopolymer transport system component